MLRMITGLPGSGKSSRVRALLRAALRRGLDCVLLVPEQQAVLWERELAASLPSSAWLHLELTNFTRLANTVFRQYGGLTQPRIDEGGQLLILWRALLSVWDSLSAYNHTSGGREDKNLPTIFSAVAELKQNGVTPAAASRAAQILTEDGECSHFAQRFSDISLIYAAYEEILHSEYSDREDVMEALCRTLHAQPFFHGKAVFIDSFYSVTVPEMRILRAVLASAAECTVTFACPRTDTEELPFLRIRQFMARMEHMAEEYGVPVEWLECTGDYRHKTSALAAITAGLYQNDTPSCTEAAENEVSAVLCADRYEEAEAVCAVIEKLVEDGAHYRDIAVAARDVGVWHGILDEAFRRHDIPAFVADAEPLSRTAPVRLISALLAVETNGYNRRDLCRLIDTGLTPLSDLEADCFAAYTQTWNLHGKRAYLGDGDTDFCWNFNPDGYRTEMSAWGRRCLRYANTAREKLLPAIGQFSAVFAEREAPVIVICREIVRFCLTIHVPEKLDALSAAQRREGRGTDSDKTAALWREICAALDKMAALLGDTVLDCGRFSGLFNKVIGSMEVGAIPTGLDMLVVGSADGVRFGEVRHMLLLDTVDGVFPGQTEENGFFREIDRMFLEGAGVNLAGKTGAEAAAEEAFMFYRLAAAPMESLHIFLPTRTENAVTVPSEPAEQIMRIAGITPTRFCDWPLSMRMRHPSARIAFRNDAERQAAEAFRNACRTTESDVAHYPYPLSAMEDHSSCEEAGALFGKSVRLTQSRLEKYASCPFGYFCTYGMALREEATAEITSPDVGMFVHAVLEQFFRECGNRTYPIPKEETEEITDRLIAAYVARLGISADNGRLSYLFLRLRRHVLVFLDAVMREFAQSQFRPVAFELPMENNDAVRIPLGDGISVTLRGVIDRVDMYAAADGKKYVRVVDYKTGTKKFSLADVRDGAHVQLLLYLFALWKGNASPDGTNDDVWPAGAVYLTVKPQEKPAPAMMDAQEARETAVEGVSRSGIYLNDREILDAMDCGLSGKYVQIREKKDGGLSGRDAIATMAEFGKLYGELTDTVRRIASEMLSGASPARPRPHDRTLPCVYCPMRPVCRYRKTTPQTDTAPAKEV